MAELLQENEKSPTRQTRQAVEAKFNQIYKQMLDIHQQHLKDIQPRLDSYVGQTLAELQ